MIIFMFNTLWFLATLSCTYFAVVFISFGYDTKFADKQYAIASIIITLLCFISWYGVYSSITQGIN
jgi:hypothetical protein